MAHELNDLECNLREVRESRRALLELDDRLEAVEGHLRALIESDAQLSNARLDDALDDIDIQSLRHWLELEADVIHDNYRNMKLEAVP